MKVSVFVNSIIKQGARAVVQASNGGEQGPPFVRWELPPEEVDGCRIGKRYSITIEESDVEYQHK